MRDRFPDDKFGMANGEKQPARAFAIRRVSFFMIFSLALSAPAAGQMLTADISSDEAVVGESLTVSVTVSNPSQANAPTPPESDDFEIRLLSVQPSMSQRVSVINGRMTQQTDYTYQFSVKPLHAGSLTLGRFTLRDNGRAYVTRPLRVTVRADQSSQNVFAEITAKRDVAYVGQPVVLTYQIWIRQFNQPGLGMLDVSNTWNLRDAQATSWGVFSQTDLSRPQYASQQREVEPGHNENFFVYYLETTVYPTKAGPFDFGDIAFVYNYPLRIGRSVFSLTLERSRKLSVKPNLPHLVIKPIPQEGRPPGYNGAIGVYSIAALAKPTQVPVGDPITLTLVIRGDGPLDRLTPPRLDQIASLTRDFEVSSDLPAGSVEDSAKRFTLTIRALRENVKQIPPIPFSFFNLNTGKFETARSNPIPLTVTPAQRIALSNLPANEGDSPETGILTPLVESSEGLFPNETNPDAVLADQSADLGAGAWSLLAVLPLAYAATSLLCARSNRFRRDQAYRRRTRALAVAKKALANDTSSPQHLRAVLTTYIADRCNIPAGGLTRADAVRILTERAISAETIQSADALLEQLELAEYAGAGGNAGGADAPWQLVQRLEREKLR